MTRVPTDNEGRMGHVPPSAIGPKSNGDERPAQPADDAAQTEAKPEEKD